LFALSDEVVDSSGKGDLEGEVEAVFEEWELE
jgi:hypothetical protein